MRKGTDVFRARPRRGQARACLRFPWDPLRRGRLTRKLDLGIPRATQDVDFVADLRLSHVDAITSALTEEFYVDADMISDAIKRRASFNVIHLTTMFKADVFVFQGDLWSSGEMDRARGEQFDLPEGRVTVRFASPEDTLLHKLIWYKLGNQVSDRQWSDILGVLKIQGEALDHAYIDRWARTLDVQDLLLRARREQRESR